MVGDERGRNLVHAHAAVLLGNIDRGEAQFTGLAHQALQDARLLGFDGCRVRQNLFAGKLRGGRGNLALLLV